MGLVVLFFFSEELGALGGIVFGGYGRIVRLYRGFEF